MEAVCRSDGGGLESRTKFRCANGDRTDMLARCRDRPPSRTDLRRNSLSLCRLRGRRVARDLLGDPVGDVDELVLRKEFVDHAEPVRLLRAVLPRPDTTLLRSLSIEGRRANRRGRRCLWLDGEAASVSCIRSSPMQPRDSRRVPEFIWRRPPSNDACRRLGSRWAWFRSGWWCHR